jgi:hypothetical protein
MQGRRRIPHRDAIGVRVHDLPITPKKVVAELASATAE